jgi:hypothetical protein
MIVILPVSLLAQDTAVAILRSKGIGVLVNKNPAPASSALFSDDLVETQKDAVARIEATGSTADINPETIVQFEGIELVLDHGSLSVNTSRGLRVRVGCLTVTPVNDAEWTHYEVIDLDGKVTVSALKNDVNIDARSSNPQQAKPSARSSRVTVREGEQKSREEKCGAAYPQRGDLAATGAIMNSPYVLWPGVGVIAGITCWAICNSDNPVSPSAP